jgi:NAD(P)H-hydrate epimerase
LLTGRGREVCGEIIVSPLDIAPSVLRNIKPAMFRLTEQSLAACVPRRSPTAHKGSNGHVLVVGGDDGMGGATAMCAEAALRVGAGLVSVLTHPAHASAIMVARPELMVRAVRPERDAECEVIDAMLSKATVVALGPGLGQRQFGADLFHQVMQWRARNKLALVLDADGLNWLAKAPAHLGDAILTPHPGEAARLLDTDTAAINADRGAALARLLSRFGGVAVLKGAGTLVGDGTDVWLCDKGNSGMATGGMGDVLTGIIAGLVAQGLAAIDAARLGVWLHAFCADICASKEGKLGLLPSDLIHQVRHKLNELSCAESESNSKAAQSGE